MPAGAIAGEPDDDDEWTPIEDDEDENKDDDKNAKWIKIEKTIPTKPPPIKVKSTQVIYVGGMVCQRDWL